MFSTENKILIGIIVLTVGLLVGGAFYLSGGSSSISQEKYSTEETLNKDLGHAKGNPDAKVKIAEYADFQCPACAVSTPVVEQMLEEYGDRIYFEYHNYPLPAHNWGRDAAYAAEAASQQGKFWDFYKVLYTKQNEWSTKNDAPEQFKKYAQEMGLDMDKFNNYVSSSEVKDKVQNSINQGNKIGVQATPTFFVNGKKYEGGMTLDQWKSVIEDLLKS